MESSYRNDPIIIDRCTAKLRDRRLYCCAASQSSNLRGMMLMHDNI